MNSPFGIGAPLAPFGMAFDWLFSDDLAKFPKTKATIVVNGADGKPATGATIAVIYGSRFVAQLPADGRELTLPATELKFNAITRGPTPHWGSTEVSLKARGRNPIVIDARNVFSQERPAVLSRAATGGATLSLGAFEGVFSEGVLEVRRGADVISQKPFRRWPAEVVVPPKPGSYVLRVNACAPTLMAAEWPFEVTPPNIQLHAPDKVMAAADIEVTWTGDGSAEDMIGLRNVSTHEFIGGDFVFNGTSERKAQLVAPFDPGRYEVVYRSSVGATVMAARPIQVLPSPLKISVPESVPAGEPMPFVWPTGQGAVSRIEVVKEGDPDGKKVAVFDTSGKNRIVAPPGTYLVRLVDRDNTRWSRRITVTPSPLLDAVPARMPPGSKVRIASNGKLGSADRIVLFPAGARNLQENRIESNWEVSNSVSFETALLPGQYELVYLVGVGSDEEMELARRRIDVGDADTASVPLTAPDSLPPLQPALLSWINPDDHRLEIWCTDCARGKPRLVRALEQAALTHLALQPGSYEVQLKTKAADGKEGRLVARKPLMVVPQKILNDVPATVSPGSTMKVRIEGKPAFFDRFAIVKARTRNPESGGSIGMPGNKQTGEIDAPDERGSYELVYVASFNDSTSPDAVLDRVPFTVK